MFTHLAKALSLCLLTISLVAGCSDHTTDPHPRERGLRYNEVSFKQTHNSYIEDSGDRFVPCLDKVHGTIESQLACHPDRPWDGGASGIELDIWLTSASVNPQTGEYEMAWDVKHAGDYDYHNRPSLVHYLNRLKEWSYAHPDHNVITVKIEEKKYGELVPSWLQDLSDFLDQSDYDGYQDFYERGFVPHFAGCLDAYIEKHFDTGLLYTPKQLKGSAATLLAGANAGWPTLDELKGKFIFYVMGAEAGKNYAGNRPEDRLCFQRGGIDDENCVFTSISGGIIENGCFNSAYIERVGSYRQRQPAKIFSTYLGHHEKDCGYDIPWIPQPKEPAENALDWGVATACGINLIQTDKVNDKYATVGSMGYWPIMKKQWERQEMISSGTCHSAPASAVYRNVVYVLTNDKPDLGYLTLDGGGWSHCKDTGSLMAGAPAAAVYHDVLWVAFRGSGGTNLWVTSYDGNSWNQNKIGTAGDSPGMAVYQDKLYLMYPRNNSDEKLVYRTYDGSGWSGEVLAVGASESAPALCVFDNRLQAIYRGAGSGNTYISSFGGSNWSSQTRLTDINGVLAGKAPAVVVNGDEMLVVTRGDGSTSMYSFSIKESGEISGQRAVTLGSTEEAVSLLNHEGEIWMFHRNQGDGGDHLFVQYLDADY